MIRAGFRPLLRLNFRTRSTRSSGPRSRRVESCFMTLPPPRNAAPHHEPGDDRTTTEGGTKSPWTEVQLDRTDVRFGSIADICSAKWHVRFTPNSDGKSGFPHKVTLYPRQATLPIRRHFSRLFEAKPHPTPHQPNGRQQHVTAH